MEDNQFWVDLEKQLADVLAEQVDFSALSKSLAEMANIAIPDIGTHVLENFQLPIYGNVADACQQMFRFNGTSLEATCLNALAEQLKNSVCQTTARQWADVLLKNIQTLPIENSEVQQEIPVEKAQEILADAKSWLPEEAADAVDLKIKTDVQPSGRIPWRTVIEIITFIICVLSFVKECLPDDQLGKIIELLSQNTEITEDSGDIFGATDNPIYEIALQNQMPKESQGNQENGNVGNQTSTL